MADLFHHFPIEAPLEPVWSAVSDPAGLDSWWTKTSSGIAELGSEYRLGFGPGFDWRAEVTRCSRSPDSARQENASFELGLVDAAEDWVGTRVSFELEGRERVTHVRFTHGDWSETNSHFRVSSFCWAMYLRLMKRFVEIGELVPYEDRLDA